MLLPADARLLGRHAPDDPVTFGDAPRTAAALRADAGAVAAALPPAEPGSTAVLMFVEDRYLFTAALVGAWAAGYRVALPPNVRRETILAVMDGLSTAGDKPLLVHDARVGTGLDVAAAVEASGAPPIGPLPDAAVRATVFTSGSTGAMQAWEKGPRHLLGEATLLAEAFGVEPGAALVATVPPGHIYGLLFSVLLPLVAGGRFNRGTPLHAEAVAAVADGADILATVPAHVRALAELAPGRLGGLRRVFCSTGPLPEASALRFAERQGVTITELLGSSETGGIAWRDRTAGARWTPLPGVDLTVQGDRLWVRSPHGSPDAPMQTADRVRFAEDGTFEHLGRADGVVKVGGRRVSLPAVEAWLHGLDGVTDAAVIAQPDASGRGQVLWAALALDAPDRWTEAALKARMRDRFEASTVPRRFALVEALPREDNGKLQRGRLLALFDAQRRVPERWTLRFEPVEGDGDGYRARTTIAPDFGWFKGHFVGHPILAGAVQLRALVLDCARQAGLLAGRVTRIDRLKFLTRIGPGDALLLHLRPTSRGLDFTIHRGDELCSSGRLICAPVQP